MQVIPTIKRPTPYRVGKWLPSDQVILDNWLTDKVAAVENDNAKLLPVVQEFKELIEGDPEIYMLFHLMFEQVPFKKNPAGKRQVKDYHTMLRLISHILTHAPVFDKTCLVGFPISAILDWPMGTTAGFSAFLNPKVNLALKNILNEWGVFLSSKDSCSVLNTDPHKGWLGKDAMEAMPDFVKHFECDPELPHFGFKSWDDFFSRRFREGQRPIASPDDDFVIVNACESAPFRIEKNVKRLDKFWIKSQPYSLQHMMANDPLVPFFEGGTIYQAFLSAFCYHRWHSPVSGKIVKSYIIEGSYYAEAQCEGFDPSGPDESQGYITEVATRALIYIQADNPAIGLMCVMLVGMAEVSTCEVTIYEGQHVKKGDQLGMFHFGGSTHCLFFGPQVKLEFDLRGETPGLYTNNFQVNSKLAVVLK